SRRRGGRSFDRRVARAGGGPVAGSPHFDSRVRARWDENLDTQGAPVMGGTMGSTMKPPEHAPDFLAACGWAGAEILPLAGDASFRRYFRVVEGERTAVLRAAPPPHEDPRPFVAVAEWLASVGLSAPQILARDLDKGLLLLGDFGDWRLREVLDEDPSRERDLYEL